jgi:hypothetical protein
MNKLLSITLIFILMVFSACDGGGSGSDKGGLEVYLTDAPADYDGVFITIDHILIHQSVEADELSSGWKEVTINPALIMPINLLDLKDTTILLAEDAFTPGLYQQIPLVLKENTDTETFNYILLKPEQSGDPQEKIPLDLPGSEKNRLKMVSDFQIVEGEITELTMDFDADHSVVETGSDKFILKPVIKILPQQNPSGVK